MVDRVNEFVYNGLKRFWEPVYVKPPPPPPLPKYDPNEEAPKWTWNRLWWGPVMPEVRPDIPKRGGVAKTDDTPDWRGVIKQNVIPAEHIKKYDFGQPEYQGYYWFDTPDYADPFKKLWSSFKIIARISVATGCVFAITKGMDFDWKTHKLLWKRYTGPLLLGGMAASLTVITVANLRGKKDDMWNYFAGAMTAAAITGRASYHNHARHMVYWTFTTLSVKYMNEVNGVLLPVINERMRNLGISGHNAQEGLFSGEIPLRWRGQQCEDPGRDVRRHPL